MAKRKYKKRSIVSGKSVYDILHMSIDDFEKLGVKDLQKVVGRLVSAGNKRLRSFERAGESSPATRYILEKSGGMFTTKGKDLQGLRSEYKRAKGFLMSETGTRAGWNKVRKKTIKSLKKKGVDIRGDVERKIFKDITNEDEQTFKEWMKDNDSKREFTKLVTAETNKAFDKMWRAYEDLKEISPEVANRNLKYGALQEIVNLAKDESLSADEIALKLQDQITEIYEKQARENNAIDGVSGFFEIE